MTSNARQAVVPTMVVAVGSMTANLAGYLLHLPASRWLGPAGYGEFASLLAVQLLLAVPALAVQVVVAREVVHGASAPQMRALTWRVAALTTLVVAGAIPLVAMALHAGVLATSAALVGAPATVMLSGEQGLLQGQRQFRALAVVLGAAGVGRVAPAVVALAFGGGAALALGVGTVGTAAVAVITRCAAGSSRSREGRFKDGLDEEVGIQASFRRPAQALRSLRSNANAQLLSAVQVQLVLVALSSVDVVVGRGVLSAADAGRYALGAVATKVAFWAPQAVAVVRYPQMADPAVSRRAVRMTLGLLVIAGAVVVSAVAALAPLVPSIAGRGYVPIIGLLWVFALEGAALAVLQGSMLAAIAENRTRVAIVAWIGLAVALPVMLTWGHTTHRLLAIAASTAVAAAAMAAAAQLLPLRRRP